MMELEVERSIRNEAVAGSRRPLERAKGTWQLRFVSELRRCEDAITGPVSRNFLK